MTAEDQQAADDIEKHLADKWWRLSHLYIIKDEDGKVVPFEPRQEQEEFFRERHSRNFILKARKLGMSTLLVLDALDDCIFGDEITHCAHIDKTEKDARDKLAIASFAWHQGPLHPDPVVAEIWQTLHEENPLVTDRDGRLKWQNGSMQEAGISFRGGTPQKLHVSELGEIAATDAKRAREIKEGAFNAVATSGQITVETTHKGGKFGECYALAKLAMDSQARDKRSILDWKFFFFPWYEHPSYRLPGIAKLSATTVEYFAKLEKRLGHKISIDRKAWYEAKSREQTDAMLWEFPSTPDEAFMTRAEGAIYPIMLTLRSKGRVREFEHERNFPLFTSWDLGISDSTAGWVTQFAGKDLNWLAWYEGEGHGAAQTANIIRGWEAQFAGRFSAHFVPHDANVREKGTTKTYVQCLVEAGIPQHTIVVVPRNPDVWNGINDLRDLLPRSWFHARCDVERKTATGAPMPSGVAALENYRKTPMTPAGALRETPLHDACSHTADAARTMAEAFGLGLVQPFFGARVEVKARKPNVVMGFAGNGKGDGDDDFWKD